MTTKMKNYTEEFKRKALEMIQVHGMSKTSKDLGVSPVTLRSWRKKSTDNEPLSSDVDLKKEIKRLQKENMYIKKINEVLKKSTAIFAQAELPPFK